MTNSSLNNLVTPTPDSQSCESHDFFAREALIRAIQRTGILPESQEEPKVLRKIASALVPPARDISDDVYYDILVLVRKRHWVSRLLKSTRLRQQVWVTREDVEDAVEAIPNPLERSHLTDEMLQNALASVLKARVRGYGKTPRKAFNNMRSDLVDAGIAKGIKTLSLVSLKSLLEVIAEAFNLSSDDPFITTTLQEERERQDRETAIQQA
ncbi:MAG: hypothetical protein J6U18_05580, partial [Acetobacter sp.]|nr:hypothetical protein [Acetobacter sp.]